MDAARRLLQGRRVFDLLYDRRNGVLRTRFHGALVEGDIVLRDNAVARFVERHGAMRGIMDYTAVDAVEVAVEFIVKRATAPPLLSGTPRIIVAPREPGYSLNRIVAAHQLYSRGIEPVIVATLEEAHRALGIAHAAYALVGPDDATRLERAAFAALAGIERRLAPAAAERERMHRTMRRLLDSAIAGDGAPGAASSSVGITFADVLNAQLRGARLRDADIATRCARCRRRMRLSTCRIVPGRRTAYACGRCGGLLLVLSHADRAALGSYRLGRFNLQAYADIDCPGGRLPRSSAADPSHP